MQVRADLRVRNVLCGPFRGFGKFSLKSGNLSTEVRRIFGTALGEGTLSLLNKFSDLQLQTHSVICWQTFIHDSSVPTSPLDAPHSKIAVAVVGLIPARVVNRQGTRA